MTGQTETNKTDSYITTQAEIAKLFNVNRTTVKEWGDKGLPFKSGGRGCPSEYDIGVTLYWYIGREWCEPFNNSTLLIQLTIGYLVTQNNCSFGKSELKSFIDLMKRAGFSNSPLLILTLGQCRQLLESRYQLKINWEL